MAPSAMFAAGFPLRGRISNASKPHV